MQSGKKTTSSQRVTLERIIRFKTLNWHQANVLSHSSLPHDHSRWCWRRRRRRASCWCLRQRSRLRFEGMGRLEEEPQWDFSCDLEVDFESDENASIVHAALAVDKELQPDKVKRTMCLSSRKLSVHFEAVEARFLRASFSSLVDNLTLATKTIEQFGTGTKL